MTEEEKKMQERRVAREYREALAQKKVKDEALVEKARLIFKELPISWAIAKGLLLFTVISIPIYFVVYVMFIGALLR